MKKNAAYLDVLRLMATLVVVLIHTVSGVTSLMPGDMTATQITTYDCIKNICTIGVPIFLMISGVLFLDPRKEMTLKDLICKYIRRIVLALVIFGTGYALLEIVFNTKDFKIVYLWNAFYNMLVGNTWGHMWYLYMIILVYLMVPIFRPLAASNNKTAYTYVLVLLGIITSVAPFIKNMTGFCLGLGISAVQITEFGVYIFYFLAGYYIHSYVAGNLSDEKQKINTKQKAICIACIAASLLLVIFNSYMSLGLYISYDSPIILILAVSIFVVFSGYKGVAKFAGAIRPYLFGIYLVHTFYLNLLYKLVGFTPLSCGGYILIPVFVIMVFILSVISVWILRLIPPLKKYVM